MKIKSGSKIKTAIESLDSRELFQDAITHLQVVESDFTKRLVSASHHKYASFALSYFVLRKIFDLDYQEPDKYFSKIWIIPNAEKNTAINFLGVILNTRTKKIEFTDDFLEFLETKQLQITEFGLISKTILFCMKIKEFLGFYFDESYYVKSLVTVAPVQKYRCSLNYEDFTYFREKFEDLHSKIKWKSDEDAYYIDEVVSRRGHPGTKSLLKYEFLSSNNYYLNRLLQLYNPTSKRFKLNQFKSSKNISDKIAHVIFDQNNFSKKFYSCFDIVFKACREKPWFIKKIMVLDENEVIKVGSNIKNAYVYFGIKIQNKNITRVMFNELISLDIQKNSRYEDLGRLGKLVKPFPQNKIFFNEPLIYNDYEVQQIRSVNELQAIGSEFRNCLHNTSSYSDNGLRGSSLFFVFRGKDKFVAEIGFDGYDGGRILEAKRPQNRELSPENYQCLNSFVNEKLLFITQELVSEIFTFLQHISQKNQETSLKFLAENLNVLHIIFKKMPFINSRIDTQYIESPEYLDSILKKIKSIKENHCSNGGIELATKQLELDV